MSCFIIVRYQKQRLWSFAFNDIANYCTLLWRFNVFVRLFAAIFGILSPAECNEVANYLHERRFSLRSDIYEIFNIFLLIVTDDAETRLQAGGLALLNFIPDGGRETDVHSVQTGSEARPATLAMGRGGCSSEAERQRRESEPAQLVPWFNA
jgi:hypothetical protein